MQYLYKKRESIAKDRLKINSTSAVDDNSIIPINKSSNADTKINESQYFFENFIDSWKKNDLEFLKKHLFPRIESYIQKSDLSFLINNDILFTIADILNAEDYELLSQAIETIGYVISVYNDSIDFFLSSPIELQNYLCFLLDDYIQKKSNFTVRHVKACIEILYQMFHINSESMNVFMELNILSLLSSYMDDSFNDVYCEEDGSGAFDIYIEKIILEIMNELIINEKYLDEEEFKNAIKIYFSVFNKNIKSDKRIDNNRGYLFEIACDLFIHLISEDPLFILELEKVHTFQKCCYFIYEVEDFKLEYLSPIFELFAEVFDKKEVELQYEDEQKADDHQNLVNDAIDRLASSIDGSSILGYLQEGFDFDLLSNETIDYLYINIFQFLNGLIMVMEEIPDDFDVESLSEYVNYTLNEGRNEVKLEMMNFLLTFCKYSSNDNLKDLLDYLGTDVIDSFLLNLGSYDVDVFDSFLDFVESLLSKIGRFEQESDEITYFLNDAFPKFIDSMLETDLDEKIEAKTRSIMETYYKDFNCEEDFG